MLLFWSKKARSEKQLQALSGGGDGEIRTHDLSDANRTLYQLSYAPKYLLFSIATHISIIDFLQKSRGLQKFFSPENLRHGW